MSGALRRYFSGWFLGMQFGDVLPLVSGDLLGWPIYRGEISPIYRTYPTYIYRVVLRISANPFKPFYVHPYLGK